MIRSLNGERIRIEASRSADQRPGCCGISLALVDKSLKEVKKIKPLHVNGLKGGIHMESQKNLTMNRICEHCDEEIVGNASHVTSEYQGELLLDMTVCAGCAAVARSLGLRTEEIMQTLEPTQQSSKLLVRGRGRYVE